MLNVKIILFKIIASIIIIIITFIYAYFSIIVINNYQSTYNLMSIVIVVIFGYFGFIHILNKFTDYFNQNCL